MKVQVKDNGQGISDKRKEILFREIKPLKRKADGMRMGLSLVKRVIDLYGGKIWVEDRIKGDYRQGSNFVLLLPKGNGFYILE